MCVFDPTAVPAISESTCICLIFMPAEGIHLPYIVPARGSYEPLIHQRFPSNQLSACL